MRVLFVTAEAYPLAKTGGLADVSRALPIALARQGVDVRLLLPGYPRAYTRIEKPRIVAKLDPMLGIADATLVSGKFPDTDLSVWLIDSPHPFPAQRRPLPGRKRPGLVRQCLAVRLSRPCRPETGDGANKNSLEA